MMEDTQFNIMAFLLQMFPLGLPWLQGQEDISSLLHKLFETDCNKVVIYGPDRADKTSLVFQASVSTAAMGGQVTYICTHPLKKLPMPVHGMSVPEPSVMRNVDFLYYEEVTDLITWCSKLHLTSKLPTLIIVEDILSYATQISEANLEKSLAKLCAMLVDTCSWTDKYCDDKKCTVIMTAPTRINSLKNIFNQFDFKLASYQGPRKEEKNSELSFESSDASICVRFHRQKDSIFLKDVEGQYIHS